MNPNTVIGAAILVLAPINVATDLVTNTAKKVKNVAEEAKCEMVNRLNFDKKHGYIRRSKR